MLFGAAAGAAGGVAQMAIGTGMNIIGGLLAAGDKPEVPPFRKINAAEEQLKAIEGNLQAFGPSKELASKVNQFNQQELDQALSSAIPDYNRIKKQASANIASQLKGEIPVDVQKQIQRNAAAQALGGGYAGGGMHRNLMARDLGLTSLGIQQQGQSSAERWIANMRQNALAPQMNVSSMFFTPSQRLAHEVSERDKELQHRMFQASVDAAPDPMLAAVGRGLMSGGNAVTYSGAYSLGQYGGMPFPSTASPSNENPGTMMTPLTQQQAKNSMTGLRMLGV